MSAKCNSLIDPEIIYNKKFVHFITKFWHKDASCTYIKIRDIHPSQLKISHTQKYSV